MNPFPSKHANHAAGTGLSGTTLQAIELFAQLHKSRKVLEHKEDRLAHLVAHIPTADLAEYVRRTSEIEQKED